VPFFDAWTSLGQQLPISIIMGNAVSNDHDGPLSPEYVDDDDSYDRRHYRKKFGRDRRRSSSPSRRDGGRFSYADQLTQGSQTEFTRSTYYTGGDSAYDETARTRGNETRTCNSESRDDSDFNDVRTRSDDSELPRNSIADERTEEEDTPTQMIATQEMMHHGKRRVRPSVEELKTIDDEEDTDEEVEVIKLVDIDEGDYDRCIESGEEVSTRISLDSDKEMESYMRMAPRGMHGIDMDELYPTYPKFGATHSNSLEDGLDNNSRDVQRIISALEARDGAGSLENREPLGMKVETKASDASVEASFTQLPQERMAQDIMNARIKQALRYGLDSRSGSFESKFQFSLQQSLPSPTNGAGDDATGAGNALSDIDDVDLKFVQQYELAFEMFLQRHIGLMTKNPELVYNLRVAKLQQVLETVSETEAKMMEIVEKKRRERSEMVAKYKKQLTEAARQKASLEVNLRQALASIQQATAAARAKLYWEIVVKNDQRAKRHYHLLKKLSREKAHPSRLLWLLPDQPDMREIRDAATVPSGAVAYERDLQQYQVDNALLKAEVKVLEKKLAYEQVRAGMLRYL